MEIPYKRLRLDQTDPSIALQNGESPFLDASDDVIDKIFRTLSAHGEKYKMNMELVCRRFQVRIRRRSAWKDDIELALQKSQHGVLINYFEFTFEKAHLALSNLLDRIEVKDFDLGDISGILPNILLALCHTITQHKDFINLEDILFCSFSTNVEYTPLITSLTDCGLQNLSDLEFGYCYGELIELIHVQYLPHSVYSMLPHCPNLKYLHLKVENISPVCFDMLVPALAKCTHIKIMHIDSLDSEITHQNAIGFAQVCSSTFSELTVLSFIQDISNFVPFEFITALGEQLRSNITEFIFVLDAQIDTHRQFLVSFSNWFPKLNVLNIYSGFGFPTETVLEAIGNIFANYSHPGNDVYKFQLIVYVENWGHVLSQLAQKRWVENGELVKIISSDGIWTCIKDNVEIKLSLSYVEELID